MIAVIDYGINSLSQSAWLADVSQMCSPRYWKTLNETTRLGTAVPQL